MKAPHGYLKYLVLPHLILCTGFASATSSSLPTYEEYVRRSAVPKDILKKWVSDIGWVKFDPELGYVQSNSNMPWGMNGSACIETIQKNGARTTIMYAGQLPRINTYGDSFTECEQVSDGETWQEYMAGHLGEPVANFGVGGYGVYQAFRRMLREEQTSHGAKYVILTICCDDSIRSLFRSRRTLFYEGWPEFDGLTFHGNFWSNIELDLDSGRFIEHDQILPTKESLYHMTDPGWMYRQQKDDLAAQLALYARGSTADFDQTQIARLAHRLSFALDPNLTGAPARQQARALLNLYAQRATVYILDKAKQYLESRGKTLIVVLNGNTNLEELRTNGTRQDQEVVDWLKQKAIVYVDMNEIFLKRSNDAKLLPREYMVRYLVDGLGHFNPAGNHVVAYAIIEKIVPILQPAAFPYQSPDRRGIDFGRYLSGGVYETIAPSK